MPSEVLQFNKSSPIIVALDYKNANQALALVDRLIPKYCKLKIGKEMFTRFGPALIIELQQRGFEIFLDLKFHDIPNTVARAVSAAADLGVWMVNIHASGGEKMMIAARDALSKFGSKAPKLIAVTLLTSISNDDLNRLGITSKVTEFTIKLAMLANYCGIDGVVCSAHEAAEIKSICGNDFTLVTPGIRLAALNHNDDMMGDHDRVMTAKQAQQAGVDYIVIGRPITMSETPDLMLKNILRSLHLN
ncbi:orotidine-5'-phosphate decarboxylase [Candidatus Palibaumannia cicadellinicola]|uniref:Orotidine 5'-phosphate decarboxylase n=1 Tax=Candidatus Palibaumannia cicadellinicola TaxID=186490 RepID=A0A0K2BKB2_9GAMM|nr:orotidine-5'-phosphate decarboxylase [Candidatus Baumannia cicadellinicola]AKZ65846.1 Orotidine 5'-phosphate decarboxylase [Candidatus Baumannia cicadellinicola]